MYIHKERTWKDERDMLEAGIFPIAGADEAGRGPLAGPVVTAAVSFPRDVIILGIKDSKALNKTHREALYQEITEKALSISITQASPEEIDKLNIYQSTKLCIAKALFNMDPMPEFAFVDGLFDFDDRLDFPIICVPGGDGAHIYNQEEKKGRRVIGHHFQSIGAASIIAKVWRDRLMVQYAEIYPEYGFEAHKGYGTKQHLQALEKHGPCEIHRRTFKPVIKYSRSKSEQNV